MQSTTEPRVDRTQGGPNPGWTEPRVHRTQGGPNPGWTEPRVDRTQGGPNPGWTEPRVRSLNPGWNEPRVRSEWPRGPGRGGPGMMWRFEVRCWGASAPLSQNPSLSGETRCPVAPDEAHFRTNAEFRGARLGLQPHSSAAAVLGLTQCVKRATVHRVALASSKPIFR